MATKITIKKSIKTTYEFQSINITEMLKFIVMSNIILIEMSKFIVMSIRFSFEFFP